MSSTLALKSSRLTFFSTKESRRLNVGMLFIQKGPCQDGYRCLSKDLSNVCCHLSVLQGISGHLSAIKLVNSLRSTVFRRCVKLSPVWRKSNVSTSRSSAVIHRYIISRLHIFFETRRTNAATTGIYEFINFCLASLSPSIIKRAKASSSLRDTRSKRDAFSKKSL